MHGVSGNLLESRNLDEPWCNLAALIAKVGGCHVPPIQKAVVTVSGTVQATAKQQFSTLVKESLIFFKNRHSFTFIEKCME